MGTIDRHKQQLRQEFDQWAEAGRGEGMRHGHWDMTIQTIEKMQLAGNETVLDMGCGNGWAAREIAKKLPEGQVCGIDISEKMIAEARERSVAVVNAEFKTTGADQLPFQEKTFDHILNVESFYYYPDLDPVVTEISRMLKPGGIFWCVVDLYRENPYSMTWPEKLNVPVHTLGEQEYREIFTRADFTIHMQERIIDRRPLDPEKFKSGWGTPTFEDYKKYKSLGSLLTAVRKYG